MRTVLTRRRAAGAGGVALALATLICATGCSSSGSGSADTGFISADRSITVLPVEQRSQPVALAGTTLTGDRFDVASLRGKVVVLNVWGSWCTPCREEATALQAAYAQLRPTGVEFLGIDTKDPDPAPAVAYTGTFGVGYPSLYDKGGQLLLSLRGTVPPNAIPTTLVLDGQGRVAARITGSTTKATLVGVVEDVLGRRTGQSPSPAASAAPSPAASPS